MSQSDELLICDIIWEIIRTTTPYLALDFKSINVEFLDPDTSFRLVKQWDLRNRYTV